MVLAIGCAGGARDRQQPSTTNGPAWHGAAAYQERFVAANGVRLKVLDFGGTGPARVLIQGYGDSPHAFDGLAPALAGRFQVVGYARRGDGSSTTGASFSNATLAAYLVAVLDSLGIAKSNIAGWSMGGNEITAAAGLHPDRVDRIVYLDAGYDWADSAFAASLSDLPLSIDPPATARTDIDALKRWWMESRWPTDDVARVEAYLRDISGVATDGTLPPVPDSANAAHALAALLAEHRDYRKVKAPALAIYAAQFLPPQGKDRATTAATGCLEATHMVPFRVASQARMRNELRGVRRAHVPGSHGNFIFVSRDSVAALFTTFLGDR
ncbi:MAG: alpha/beta fold hydrolase [Gemmatimonadetes bacterium]|nr:alpha/beta fold hydrolase [Gemmatimonadota bacterium]